MSALGGLASPLRRAVLLLGGVTSSSPLVTLGMGIREPRALLKRLGRPLKELGQTLGAEPPDISPGALGGGVRTHHISGADWPCHTGQAIVNEPIHVAALDHPDARMALGTNRAGTFFDPPVTRNRYLLRLCGRRTLPAIVGGGYRSLAEGARVSYETESGAKGPKAVNVEPV